MGGCQPHRETAQHDANGAGRSAGGKHGASAPGVRLHGGEDRADGTMLQGQPLEARRRIFAS